MEKGGAPGVGLKEKRSRGVRRGSGCPSSMRLWLYCGSVTEWGWWPAIILGGFKRVISGPAASSVGRVKHYNRCNLELERL